MKFEESVKKNKNQDLKLLAYNVKRLRIDNKLSQKELAENIGVKELTINRLETAKTFPKTGTILKIRTYFKVSYASLFNAPDNIKHTDDFIKLLNNMNENQKRSFDTFLNYLIEYI